ELGQFAMTRWQAGVTPGNFLSLPSEPGGSRRHSRWMSSSLGSLGIMTGEGPSPRSLVRRIRARQELQLAAALSRADRPMAAGWWALLGGRGLPPARFSHSTGAP